MISSTSSSTSSSERIRFVAELEHDVSAVDAEAVQDTSEELPAVQASRDRNRHLGSRDFRLPLERLRAAHLLRLHPHAAGELELDRFPLVGDVDVELDETATCAAGSG